MVQALPVWNKKSQQSNMHHVPENNSEQDDTAEHILFNYHSYQEERTEMNRRIGQTATTENLISIILASEERWQAVENFFKAVIKKKPLKDADLGTKLRLDSVMK
ncbi:hypothetical protein BIW11_09074 [Tropilaelaps mercedesae]|uniref:Uncharacterized protein n=1 Tax=Tropilaelaps mercedesae TaxID=418985 RepID=A0A1V9XLM8_9ACAR|nr:hypothetical protein BIW11_09074 [Tropilaelaps mercedesae]